MNVHVEAPLVDPLFVKLCAVHGLPKEVRATAEEILRRARGKKEYQTRRWYMERAPWPCYADEPVRVELVKNEYVERQTVRRIIIAVAKEYGVTEGEICSIRRTANLITPRHIAMYLAKVITTRSFPEIGRRFGGRDHTTILHACQKIERMMAESESFAAEVNALRAKLEGAK